MTMPTSSCSLVCFNKVSLSCSSVGVGVSLGVTDLEGVSVCFIASSTSVARLGGVNGNEDRGRDWLIGGDNIGMC